MKYYTLLIVLFLPFLCLSQNDSCDCSKYVDYHYDKISGATTKGNFVGFKITDGSTTADVLTLLLEELDLKASSIALFLYFGYPAICPSEGDNVTFLFTDNTRYIAKNISDYNCKGKIGFYLGGKTGDGELLELLSTKKVEAMGLSTNLGICDLNFKIKDGVRLHNEIICLKKLFK